MRGFLTFLQLIVFYSTAGTGQSRANGTKSAALRTKDENPIVEKLQSAKHDNPNYVRDRLKDEIYKPQYPPFSNRFKKPYHPAWQDYCDPYHCNDYHKIACGLHRKKMRFQWFQSTCHLILNNQCATYRGALKYDIVANKYCQAYVMFLRAGCADCDDKTNEEPICAVRTSTTEVVLLENRCRMEKENCERENTEYVEVQMFLCEFYLHSLKK